MTGHRILDIAIACGGAVIVDKNGASVSFDGTTVLDRALSVSSTEGLTFEQAVSNLEVALGRRGIDFVRGGHGGS